MTRAHRAGLVLLTGCALLAACGGDGEEIPDASTAVSEEPVAPVVRLSEGEVLAVLGALNGGAADFARITADSVADPDLRRLLRVIRVDHEALQAELGALADTLQLTAGGHAAAERLRTAAQEHLAAVAGAAPGSADEAVLQRQIELHQLMLTTLDSLVVPGTQQPLLAQYVAAARPTIGAHLQRARQVETLLRERAAAAASVPRPPTERPATPPPATEPPPQSETATDTTPQAPPDSLRLRARSGH